jgi:hypothetical protein
MSDEILKAVNDLREKVTEIDIKLESMNSELRPFVHLVRGNGRPGLEARLYHNEQKVDSLESHASWSLRFGVSALVAAVGTVVWQLLIK